MEAYWLRVNCTLKLTCEGDADISTKHEFAVEQDPTVGHPQSRPADDRPSIGSQSTADTGDSLSLLHDGVKSCSK